MLNSGSPRSGIANGSRTCGQVKASVRIEKPTNRRANSPRRAAHDRRGGNNAASPIEIGCAPERNSAENGGGRGTSQWRSRSTTALHRNGRHAVVILTKTEPIRKLASP